MDTEILEETESPIERILLENMVKHVADGVTITPQKQIQTRFLEFRADFHISNTGHAVIVECDGSKFHKNRAHEDEIRDAILLGSGHVTTVYRFSGRSLYRSEFDVMHILLVSEPWIFSSRGRDDIHRLCMNESIRKWSIGHRDAMWESLVWEPNLGAIRRVLGDEFLHRIYKRYLQVGRPNQTWAQFYRRYLAEAK